LGAAFQERFVWGCPPDYGRHLMHNDGGARLISQPSGILSTLSMLPPL
jgi:hypothetical protein